VSEKLPSREQAIQFLYESGCSARVMRHCEAVAKLAVETAETLRKKGLDVDVALVEIGALLHDVGRSKTHTVHHAIVGAEIAKSAKMPEPVVSILKRHVGGGITADEAKKLEWPADDVYIPFTLEEKIVSYADKLIASGKRVPVERTIEQLFREAKPEAARRVQKLHEEIDDLIGDQV
jgi:uncharacterized protein